MVDLVPGSFWKFPATRLSSLWDDEDDLFQTSGTPSGLTVSEDEKKVYVEAALPGIDPKNVDITFDKGMLWIKGETKEEEKSKKFYRKATNSFSYRVAVPGEIDQKAEPKATSKDGIMKVTFTKVPASEPKKIPVKTG
ncbi:Hsp20/alpha crystallin family protein [Patescibacteria group bacterium]